MSTNKHAYCWIPAGLALFSIATAAQQPAIGIAPVLLAQESYVFDTAELHRIRVDVVVRGLSHPYSLAFLPEGDALITERGTRVRRIRNAASSEKTPFLEPDAIAGVPAFAAVRGGGLQEIALHPDFANNQLIYLSYNKPGTPNPDPAGRSPTTLVLARARLEGNRLVDMQEIFSGGERPGASGSRLAFAPDGRLFMTTGAPFSEEAGQLNNVYGKVLRLEDDGGIPRDNPYATRTGVRPEIYSFGHRDQLGLTVHGASGTVLAAEHGPNGGDEVNIILPGRNYGWPRYSYGRTYEGPRVSTMPLGPDIEQPLLVWLPSIAPTGMVFYTGDRLSAWKGNLFIGSARRGGIPRTGSLERVVLNDKFEELRRESLLTGLHQRIRDVRQGPDGLLYLLTDEDDGALLRIAPAP